MATVIIGTLKILDFPAAGSAQTVGTILPLRLQTYAVGKVVDMVVKCNYREILRERYCLPRETTASVDLAQVLRCTIDYRPPALSRVQSPQASDNLKDIDVTISVQSTEGVNEGTASTYFYLIGASANNVTAAACTDNLLSVGPSIRRVPSNHIEVLSFYGRRGYGYLMCEASDGKIREVARYAYAWGMVDVVVDFRRLSSLFSLRNIESFYFYMEGAEGNGTKYVIDDMRPRGERWYYFVNSLGGMDCLSACGVPTDKHKFQSEVAMRNGWSIEYNIDISAVVNDNSGYLCNDSQRAHYREFLSSRHKYVREGSLLRQIIVDEGTADAERYEASQATFAWRYVDPSYPIIPRLQKWHVNRGEAGRFQLTPAFALPYPTRDLRLDFLLGGKPYNLGGVESGDTRDYYYTLSPRIKKYLTLGEPVRGESSIFWPRSEILPVTPSSITTGFLTVTDRITGNEATCMLVLEPEG